MLRRIVRRLKARIAAIPGQLRPGDPFACVWDGAARHQQQDLLARVANIAATMDAKLFLFWGSLLGQVRENRILDWDDDVDIALFDTDDAIVDRFLGAVRGAGLETQVHHPGERIIKIFDPAYPNSTGQPWSWPFIDLFVYTSPDLPQPPFEPSPVAVELVRPGRLIRFETASLWLVEKPLVVLDCLYPNWRTAERSPSWNHRLERAIAGPRTRYIKTDGAGRKVGTSSQGID